MWRRISEEGSVRAFAGGSGALVNGMEQC